MQMAIPFTTEISDLIASQSGLNNRLAALETQMEEEKKFSVAVVDPSTKTEEDEEMVDDDSGSVEKKADQIVDTASITAPKEEENTGNSGSAALAYMKQSLGRIEELEKSQGHKQEKEMSSIVVTGIPGSKCFSY